MVEFDEAWFGSTTCLNGEVLADEVGQVVERRPASDELPVEDDQRVFTVGWAEQEVL